MRCPNCQGETLVTDSRDAPENTLRRRRECVACSHRFTTYESTVQVAKRRQADRKAKRAAYRVLSADERRAAIKRREIRKAARTEAETTGVPVQDLYRRWGVE